MPDIATIKSLPRLNIPNELLPWAHRLINDLNVWLLQIVTELNSVGGGGGVPPAHDLLSTVHTDTVPGSPVRGDLVVANATPEWTRLAIGTSGKYLRADGTDPAWTTITRSDLPSEIAYEDEVNDFSMAQRFQDTIELVSISTPGIPPSGSVYLYQNTSGPTTEVRLKFDDGSECIVCTNTASFVGELPLNWVE